MVCCLLRDGWAIGSGPCRQRRTDGRLAAIWSRKIPSSYGSELGDKANSERPQRVLKLSKSTRKGGKMSGKRSDGGGTEKMVFTLWGKPFS